VSLEIGTDDAVWRRDHEHHERTTPPTIAVDRTRAWAAILMSCGEIDWWRAPDLTGLLQRHGQVEHLVVQFDFLVQAQRVGRAEFSIPNASKKGDGGTGYADIVSLATGEIWEIKPEKLEDKAVSEAAWYSGYAKKSCGPQWHPGTSFTTTNRYKIPGVVYRIEGNGNKAELVAKQGREGAVLYFWRINGKRQPALEASFAWALRQAVVKDYFAIGQTLQPLPGSTAPDNFPPGKFKPPVLMPGACIPEFDKHLKPLLESIRTTCAPTIFENGAVAVLLEASVYNAMVGPRIVAEQIGSMQVKASDPTVRLYRETLAILSGAASAHGLVGVAVGIAGALYLAITRAPAIIGGVIVFVCEEAAVTGAPSLISGRLLGTLTSGLSAGIRGAVAAGAAFLVFATPRASMADPATPVALDVSLARFLILTPAQAVAARVGQSQTVDGVEWIIAGTATTLPD
jgi:hypothetical protein